MPLREDLLAPIAEDRPGGEDVRYEAIYDQIKEARREDEDLPQGGWATTRKIADWALVSRLASEVLAKRSKDLQVAVWLSEAQLRREGIVGLRESLDLLRSLLDQFWDHLYPELEDGDAEFRAAPLEWLGTRLDAAVRAVPLNRAGHTFLQYQEGRALGYESEVTDSERRSARQAEIDAGKVAPEEFDKELEATPKEWYRSLLANVQGTLHELQALDDLGRERFGEFAPTYRILRGGLEELQRTAKVLLQHKLAADPDPEPVPGLEPEEAGPAAAASGDPGAEVAFAAAPASTVGAGPVSWIVAAAQQLRRQGPTDPTPYLLLRAFRFGEVRAQAALLEPTLLEAPGSTARTQLKHLQLQAAWAQLLEAAEEVMATPAGRGWLDLQRYAVLACRSLGAEYDAVARAVCDELRALLSAAPALLDATLMDGMPTATPETREWIRAEVLSATGGGAEAPAAVPGLGEDRVLARAEAEVRAGRVGRAVELLMRELDRETSRRNRFLRQTQVVRILVDADLPTVARPILQEMLDAIETHQLERWESGSMVGEPVALMHRVLKGNGGAEDRLQELYVRLCRLDPVRAIELGGK